MSAGRPGNAIDDFTALTDREFVIIERGGGQGDASDSRQANPALFEKIFRIDLDDVDAQGNPRDVAGDGRTRTVFTFRYATIEDVLVLDDNRLLVVNDNSYPGSAGRAFGVPDNNEFILIHVAPLLDCDDTGRRRHEECGIARDQGESASSPPSSSRSCGSSGCACRGCQCKEGSGVRECITHCH